MKRLGRNCGCYLGETIVIKDVLSRIQASAEQIGWRYDCFLRTDEFSLCAYHRSSDRMQKRVYLSTGIHGDEPAGPLAILELVQENRWPGNVDLWLCPCLNPTGFVSNRRENVDGLDLNRDYRHLKTQEVHAHVQWLQRQPGFDIALILHEDWEANGFYLYELNPGESPSLAEAVIEQVAEVCPIEQAARIDNWPANNGIIRPELNPSERLLWPEAFYLAVNKTRQSLTLEAPSDFPLATRVAALKRAVRTVLEKLS